MRLTGFARFQSGRSRQEKSTTSRTHNYARPNVPCGRACLRPSQIHPGFSSLNLIPNTSFPCLRISVSPHFPISVFPNLPMSQFPNTQSPNLPISQSPKPFKTLPASNLLTPHQPKSGHFHVSFWYSAITAPAPAGMLHAYCRLPAITAACRREKLSKAAIYVHKRVRIILVSVALGYLFAEE